PVEFRILQYRPRAWTPADSMVIGKILAEALSSTYGLDLLRQNLGVLDKQKFEDLFQTKSDWDVILFGEDQSGKSIESVESIQSVESRKSIDDSLDSLDAIDSQDSFGTQIT